MEVQAFVNAASGFRAEYWIPKWANFINRRDANLYKDQPDKMMHGERSWVQIPVLAKDFLYDHLVVKFILSLSSKMYAEDKTTICFKPYGRRRSNISVTWLTTAWP